ncbi:MAG: hypothetical protein DA330_08125 [Nitrososphaera sp.]|nr:hypothetical protein [Nitrososphaera sp.]
MKAYPLLLRNTLVLLIVFSFGFAGSVLATDAERNKVEPLEKQMKEKNLEQWFKYFVPFFNPTEAQLLEQLQKDPNSSPYYHPERFNVIIPDLGQTSSTSAAEVSPPGASDGPVSKKPEGAYMAVVLPKGMSLPSSQGVQAGGAASQESASSQQPISPAPVEQENVFPMSAPIGMNENLIQLPTPEKNYAGVWTGQYNKLIEYFDKASKSWKTSENSLRDVPVELNFSPNGQLSYKMPEREGSATFSARKGYLSIICPDVRVRGDYEVFQKDSTLLMRTSRVLVKDKMRVSLEFKLASKA